MIRELTVQYVPRMVPLAHAFYQEQRLPGKVKDEVFIKNWTYFLNSGMGLVIGSVDGEKLKGAIGGIVYPDPNDAELVAGEMFWFMGREYRRSADGIRLLDAFEDQGKKRGAKRIIMIHLEDRENSGTLRLYYKRRGYRRLETHYVKEI